MTTKHSEATESQRGRLVHDVAGVSEETGWPRSTIWQFMQNTDPDKPTLKSFKIGKKRFIRHSALLKFIDQHERAQEAADAERVTA